MTDPLADLKAECHYSDEGGFDAEGNDLGSVDALIDYKNALEDLIGREREALLSIHRSLYPERYPRESQTHHEFWDGRETADVGECYEWDSGTIEWVAAAIEAHLAGHPDAALDPGTRPNKPATACPFPGHEWTGADDDEGEPHPELDAQTHRVRILAPEEAIKANGQDEFVCGGCAIKLAEAKIGFGWDVEVTRI